MCLQVNPFDSEGDDPEFMHTRCMLDRVVNDFLRKSETTSTSYIYASTSDSSSEHQLETNGSLMPEALNSIEVHIGIPENPIPLETVARVEDENTRNKRSSLEKLIKVIGKQSNGLKDELLFTLVGVAGQNSMQTPWESSSSSCLRYFGIVANCMAFVLLLSGVLLRSKAQTTTQGDNRRRVARDMLVMLGISLTAVAPVMNMSMNISGVGGYFVPLVCLLPILCVFT